MEGDNPPSLESLLAAAVLALQGARADFKRQNGLRNLAIAVSTVIAVVAVAVALFAATSLANYKDDNGHARVESCNQYNAQQFRNRRAFKDAAEVLVAQVPTTTPEQKKFIVRYRRETAEKAVADFPNRDCSVQGLADFFSGRGGYVTTP